MHDAVLFRHFFACWPVSVNHNWHGAKKAFYLDPKVRAFREAVAREMVVARSEFSFRGTYEGPVSLTLLFYPPTRQRRDLDNLAKAPLDALTKAGVWTDDSQVKRLVMEMRGVRKGNAGFEAILAEYDDDGVEK